MGEILFISSEEIIKNKVNDGIGEVLFGMEQNLSKLKGKDDLKADFLRKSLLNELSFSRLALLFVKFSFLKRKDLPTYSFLFSRVLEATKKKWEEMIKAENEKD